VVSATSERENDASHGRRILVVDDNDDAAEALSMFLEIAGHRTRTANNGPEALDIADDFRPEVVILDIGLPGMSGYEVAVHMRGKSALAAATLVALTGWGTEEDKEKAMNAGFDFHLTKPVDAGAIDALLARVPEAPLFVSR
jgi:CheY-like chemotaxis protein